MTADLEASVVRYPILLQGILQGRGEKKSKAGWLEMGGLLV